MANVNNPYGLLPITSATGAASNYEMRQGTIRQADSTQIFRGDLVMTPTGGNRGFMTQWVAGSSARNLLGVFWGVEYLSAAQGKRVFSQFWPGSDVASTAQNSVVAWYIPAMSAVMPIFRVQADATGVAFSNIFQNADVTVNAGTTINGQSGMVLNATSGGSPGTTATFPMRILALYGGAAGAGGFGTMGNFQNIQPGTTNPYGGSATGAFNWVIVALNPYEVTGTA